MSGSTPYMERCCRRRISILPLLWASSIAAVVGLDPAKTALIRQTQRQGPRIVFQNQPGSIVFGNNGASGGSGAGPSRIVFRDSPKEIVFGGSSSASSSRSGSRSGGSGNDGHGSYDGGAGDADSAKAPVEPSADQGKLEKKVRSLEQKLLDQDMKLGKRLDALEHNTNAKLQKQEDSIHGKIGNIKDNVPPEVTPETKERVKGLEEVVTQQADELTTYQKEFEKLESSKADQETRIAKLETRLKSLQGDVGLVPVTVNGQGSGEAAKNAEANLAETKAELNAQMEAIRNTMATFEVDTRAKTEAVQKELTGKYNTLESRVEVNEGKLRGVKENSLGGALR